MTSFVHIAVLQQVSFRMHYQVSPLPLPPPHPQRCLPPPFPFRTLSNATYQLGLKPRSLVGSNHGLRLFHNMGQTFSSSYCRSLRVKSQTPLC